MDALGIWGHLLGQPVHNLRRPGLYHIHLLLEAPIIFGKCVHRCLCCSMGLSKFANAFLKKQLARLIANLFGMHAKSEVSSAYGLLLEFCSILPENLEVESRFIVLLLLKFIVVRQ